MRRPGYLTWENLTLIFILMFFFYIEERLLPDALFGPKIQKNSFFWILGSNFFGGLNQNQPRLVCAKSIFSLILKVSDKLIEKCRRSRLFGEWHLGKMGFWDMVSFWSFFGDRMANLGLIEFKLGFYIKVTYLKTFGQNGYQLAQNRPDATFWQEN